MDRPAVGEDDVREKKTITLITCYIIVKNVFVFNLASYVAKKKFTKLIIKEFLSVQNICIERTNGSYH